MTLEPANAYHPDSLDKYDWKDQITIRIADLIFFAAISLIGRTMRWETVGAQNLAAVESAGKVPIYCLWHDRIFAGTYYLKGRRIVVLTSQSLDGEYIARFLKRFGFGTVRGSSSRGGVRALVEAIRLMRQGTPMAFTVDGPRGPRYEVKAGPVSLAKKTANPILPFSVECASFWTINSWDKLQIPKPFTNARFMYGSPIYVRGDADNVTMEATRLELQNALDNLIAKGEEWRSNR